MVPLKPFAVPYVVVPRECRVQFPKPCFKGLKWGRWDCNVRGGAAESSVIRIACDLWVVRRVDRTPVFGVVRKLLTVCLCGFCPGRLV